MGARTGCGMNVNIICGYGLTLLGDCELLNLVVCD
jgi:hypothetical protein